MKLWTFTFFDILSLLKNLQVNGLTSGDSQSRTALFLPFRRHQRLTDVAQKLKEMLDL